MLKKRAKAGTKRKRRDQGGNIVTFWHEATEPAIERSFYLTAKCYLCIDCALRPSLSTLNSQLFFNSQPFLTTIDELSFDTGRTLQ
jgi:hypothetical protein